MLPTISQHLIEAEGFCYPDWTAITELIEKTVPENELELAWESVSQQWVGRIRDSLGGNYKIHETKNFLILLDAPERVTRDACEYFEGALRAILFNLDGIASDDGYGKHVVFMFSEADEYYRYIHHFDPDGENPMSGGSCIADWGYVHFAFPTTDHSSYRTVFVHEMTHGCLTHLKIPLWLNEALAMLMEKEICGTEVFAIDQEIYDKHVAHWDSETIQQFWTGSSWNIPGESFELKLQPSPNFMEKDRIRSQCYTRRNHTVRNNCPLGQRRRSSMPSHLWL